MIKAIIIDDEPLARLIIREYLGTYPQISIAQECSDGFEGLKAIQQFRPELIFLDIQMPKINGFEMLELIEEPPAVIFTTAFDEYAIRAFENHAVDYLLKPFTKERFDKAVGKWLERYAADTAAEAAALKTAGKSAASGPATGTAERSERAPSANAAPDQASAGDSSNAPEKTDNMREKTQALLETAALSPTQQNRVVVKTAGKIKIIPVEDIHYLEASDDYVKIHTHNGAFLKNKTMNYFEQTLDGSLFVRTHRSYILNIQQVTRIEPYEKDGHLCILQSGAQVPVSKSGYVKLKAILGL